MLMEKISSSSSSSQKRGWKRPISWGINKWKPTRQADSLVKAGETSSSAQLIVKWGKKGVFPRSYRGKSCREEQLIPDDVHTLCCPSILRKPEHMSMHIQLSLWDALPPANCHSYSATMVLCSQKYIFNSRGSRRSPEIATYRYCR